MIIVTNHCKNRILERYSGNYQYFLKEMKKIFKLARTNKLGKHGCQYMKKDKLVIKYKEHKIISVKKNGDYIIVTYGKRVSNNTLR